MDKNIIIPCNQRQYDFVFIDWSENLANYILGQDLRGLRESLALKPFNHFVTSKKKDIYSPKVFICFIFHWKNPI